MSEKKIKLSDLKPNPNNPRLIKDEKFKQLVKSIKDFPKMMALRPMVLDENNIVLGGNMRLKALQELGYKEIPEVWVKHAKDLTQDEIRRFIIVDNIGFGEHDWEVLANEWDAEELKEWGLPLIGFDVNAENFVDNFSLRDGHKEPFQQMTFTLADAQAERIKKAINRVEIQDGTQYGNENSNGNALHQIILEWEEQKILSLK